MALLSGSRRFTLEFIGDARQLQSTFGRLGAQTSALERRFGTAGAAATRVGTQMQNLARRAVLPAAVAIGFGIKTAIDYESAFADVRKTVEATEPGFKRISDGIRGLSKEIPTSAAELATLAGEAGALGVASKDLVDFTKVAAQLGTATDLASSDAANALARLANIMDSKSRKAFERMGSTLVDLGNKGASTESEIAEMSLRIAGAGKTLGLTESEVLGLAASLSNVGIMAEAGGSAISRAMLQMQDAVAKGGAELTNFAAVSGLSIEEFSRKFGQDAPGAIALFAAGLGEINRSGGSVMDTLKGVELNEIRVRDTLLRIAGNTKQFTETQDISNEAWKDNNALSKEAEERYKTLASQLAILRNHAQDAAIEMGEDLLPTLKEATGILTDDKLSAEQKFSKVFDLLIEEIEAATPRVAEAGGEVGVALVKGLAKGFFDADLVGKLFIGASLVRLFGGPGALRDSGKFAGRQFGKGFGVGAVAGLVLFGPALVEEAEKIGEDMREALPGPLQDVFDFFEGPFEGISHLPSKADKHLQRLVGVFTRRHDELRAITSDAGRDITRGWDTSLIALERTGEKRSRGFARDVGGNFEALVSAALSGLAHLARETNSTLSSLKVKDQIYVAKTGKGGSDRVLAQRGGHINVGAPSGDSVPAVLERGEYVLNRKAAQAIGVDKLDALNFGAAKRFQKGGAAGYPGVTGDTDFLPALGFGLSKMSGSTGQPIHVRSGRRTLAEQAALYASYLAGTGNLAAPPSPNAPHVRGIAADIAPGRERFGSVAGNFGLGFTVPSESWHIELLSAMLGARGAAMAMEIPEIARVLLKGPKGPLRSLGQAALDRVHREAQGYVNSNAPSSGIGGMTGPWVQVMREIAQNKDWSFGDWMELVQRESGGNPEAVNPSSGAFGLGQFLGSTAEAYAPFGALSHDPAEQIQAMARYIADRYGDPSSALAFHNSNNWYREGGLVGALGRAVRIVGHGVPSHRRKATTKLKKQIKGEGLPPAIVEQLAGLSEQADQFSEHAGLASQLNIFDPTGPDGKPLLDPAGNEIALILGQFRGLTEGDWTTKELGALWPLRNLLLQAADAIVAKRDELTKLLERAQERLRRIKDAIRESEQERDKLTKRVEHAREEIERDRKQLDREREKPPKRQDKGQIRHLEDRIEDHQGRIAGWITERGRVVEGLGERKRQRESLEGDGGIIDTITAQRQGVNTTRGDLLSQLGDVQGSVGLGVPLATMPGLDEVLGTYGGRIFTSALALKQLGEQPLIRTPLADVVSDALEDEENPLVTFLVNVSGPREPQADTLVALIQKGILTPEQAMERFMIALSPTETQGTALPSFEHGGFVPGPVGKPRLVVAHGGEEFLGVGNENGSGNVQNFTVNNYGEQMDERALAGHLDWLVRTAA